MGDGNLDLDPKDWATLRGLLDQLLELPAPARAAWIEQLAPPMDRFRARLSLLASGDNAAFADAFISALPIVETGQFATQLPGDASMRPPGAMQVGPYRLLREIGVGGMAAVWLAERTDILQRRQVALKLPRLLGARKELAERLAREREILATLEHPNIARLYDAGVADDGQPYLALEYVQGERLDVYCEHRALDVATRLRLFLQVARAVAHAHAQLIVHRDLKPSNILVTDAGEVRLLDFGIAKLLEGEAAGQETELTRLGGRPLTPEYAAPEQILGQPIGTAADVYSLGVVLFELLTGTWPYKLRRESRGALEDAIVQAEVPRPSSRVTDARLRRRLRGDLDTIVLKALKKSPGARYGTVAALAEDVERHLDRRPVLARPDSAGYRFVRFLVRNRLAVGVAGGVTMALLVAAGATAWQARVARQEQRRADEVKQLVASLFRSANPYFGGGKDVSAADLLRQGAQRAREQLATRLDLRAELLLIVGDSLASLGHVKEALPIIGQAAADAERAFGAGHPLALYARALEVGTRYAQGERDGARERLDALVPALKANPQVAPEHLADALFHRANVAGEEGRFDDAITDLREALAVADRHLGERGGQTLSLSTALAFTLTRARRWDEALQVAQRVHHMVFDVRALERTHPLAVDASILYGMALADAGRIREGLDQIAAGVQDALAARDEADPAVVGFIGHLARYQLRSGLVEAARASYERMLRVAAQAYGAQSPLYASTAHNVGYAYLVAGRPAAALARFDLALSVHGSQAPPARTLRTRVARAIALARLGRLDEARTAVETFSSAPPQVDVLFARGVLQRLSGDAGTALGTLRQALSLMDDAPDATVRRAGVLTEIGRTQLALAQAEQAASAFDDARRALERAQIAPSPSLAEALLGLGRARLAANDPAGAQAPLERAEAFWREFEPAHPDAAAARQWLARSRAAMRADPATR